jgi:hypothetical protein
MDNFEFMTMHREIFQRVCLVKLKRITGHRFYIHAYNLKSCAVVAHPCATCSTEQVK